MDDKIKWALLAVGVYFLYDWYTKQTPAPEVVAPGGPPPPVVAERPIWTPPEWIAPGAPAPTPPAPIAPPPPWTRPVYTPPAIAPAQQAGLTQLSDALIAQVAVSGAGGSDLAVAESARRGQRYDFHQWNYFRALTLGEQPDPSTYYGGNASDLVTAAEYMLVRRVALATGFVQAAQGMTGLGRRGGPILPWSTAWQA